MISMVNKAKKLRAEKILAGEAVGNMGFFLTEDERVFPEEIKIKLATERAKAFLKDIK